MPQGSMLGTRQVFLVNGIIFQNVAGSLEWTTLRLRHLFGKQLENSLMSLMSPTQGYKH